MQSLEYCTFFLYADSALSVINGKFIFAAGLYFIFLRVVVGVAH